MKRATFWGGALAGAVIALSGVYVLEQAHAQRGGGQGGGFGGGQGGFGPPQGGGFPNGPGGQGGFPGGPPMGMMGMGGGGAAITATDKYVYVLRGNTLYQLAADGLKILNKAELPQPQRQPRPEGPGGGAFGDPPPPPTEEPTRAALKK